MPSQPRQSNITGVADKPVSCYPHRAISPTSTSLYCGRRLRTFFERSGLIAAGRDGSLRAVSPDSATLQQVPGTPVEKGPGERVRGKQAPCSGGKHLSQVLYWLLLVHSVNVGVS